MSDKVLEVLVQWSIAIQLHRGGHDITTRKLQIVKNSNQKWNVTTIQSETGRRGGGEKDNGVIGLLPRC